MAFQTKSESQCANVARTCIVISITLLSLHRRQLVDRSGVSLVVSVRLIHGRNIALSFIVKNSRSLLVACLMVVGLLPAPPAQAQSATNAASSKIDRALSAALRSGARTERVI